MLRLNLHPDRVRMARAAENWIKKVRASKRRSALKEGLKNKYGLTHDEYERMFLAQNGRCAICRKKGTRRGWGRRGCNGKRSKKLCIDHDHSTKKVRELLCRACNFAIGSLHDNIEITQAALDYLKKHSEKS